MSENQNQSKCIALTLSEDSSELFLNKAVKGPESTQNLNRQDLT